jgi:hypothetical protein
MKKFLALIAVASVTMGTNAQSVTINKIDQTLANDYAGGCEIDLNNDGLKELIISGFPNWAAAPGRTYEDADGNEVQSDLQSWILSWNGSSYTKKEFSQLCGRRSHIIPADFNGDGNIDLYIAGEGYDYAGVYLNDGSGNFKLDSRYSVKNSNGETIAWYPRAADVADFNQDGLPDIVTIGWSNVNGIRQANCGVLINQGDGTFKNVLNKGLIGNGDVDFEMALCTVKAYDLNKDGYPDILLQGNIDNTDGAKATTSGGNQVGRTFMALANQGKTDDGTVSFYSLEIGSGVSHQMGNGNIMVEDFNNDGTPDIFVTGESPDDARATGAWEYYPQLLIGKITTGDVNEVSYTDNNSFVARAKDIRPLNANNVGVRAIDYNGDGYYDLFYDGWCTSMLDGSGNTQSGWFLPGSASGLTSYVRIPGASEQGIFFLDNGVQDALNYTYTGYHGDATYFNDATDIMTGRSMVFTNNASAVASRPDAPAGLTENVDGNTVKLSWTPATSSFKNVTYEYYLKETTKGVIYNNVTSFIGGEKDGVRKVLRDGNAYMNTSLNLNLADGTYEWGVQTVNAAQMGSTFAKGKTFIIGSGTGIKTGTNNDENKEVARYNISGQQVSVAQKGINIVKMSNGDVKKIIIK